MDHKDILPPPCDPRATVLPPGASPRKEKKTPSVRLLSSCYIPWRESHIRVCVLASSTSACQRWISWVSLNNRKKHGGHHGGELIPTLFIDMKDDPDCQTTPQKETISYIAGSWT